MSKGKKPTKAGLYWARYNTVDYDMIVIVRGEAPFCDAEIVQVFELGKTAVKSMNHIPVESLDWGPEIVRPK